MYCRLAVLLIALVTLMLFDRIVWICSSTIVLWTLKLMHNDLELFDDIFGL